MSFSRLISSTIATLSCALVLSALAGGVCAAQERGQLPLPEVPSELRQPQDRAAYIVQHFWDEMDFADTLRSCSAEFMEGHFCTYASLFAHCPPKMLPAEVRGLMKKAECCPQAWQTLAEVAEKYLYGPHSPVFCESHYLLFINSFLRSPLPPKSQKEKYRFQKRIITMNAPGSKAADFRYADQEGREHRMRAMEADKLLLMFYDPLCSHCTKTIRALDANRTIRQALQEGRLKILRVNINDTNLEGRYFIETLPALYLLDNRKRVILKEATVPAVAECLE